MSCQSSEHGTHSTSGCPGIVSLIDFCKDVYRNCPQMSLTIFSHTTKNTTYSFKFNAEFYLFELKRLHGLRLDCQSIKFMKFFINFS